MMEQYKWKLKPNCEMLTSKDHIGHIMYLTDGPMRYMDWCKAEVKRINKLNPERKARYRCVDGQCYVEGRAWEITNRNKR